MRILITGGSSYLGRHLVPMALKQASVDLRYSYFQHDPLDLSQGVRLDMLDEAAVHRLVVELSPEVIIHTVGSNRGSGIDAIIRQGTAHIAAAAETVKARLIHISTDVVFNGLAAPYDELDEPTPVNEYGRAKAAAELIVAGCTDHVIIRTSLIYGLGQMDHGTKWMSQALREGQPVTLFTNQRRNPVWVETLCQACLELAEIRYTGPLHVAGRQVMSRAEFAMKMLDWWGIKRRDTLTLGPSIGGDWPLDCELRLSRAENLLSTPLLGVDEVIQRH